MKKEDLNFGDKVYIEQKRHIGDNEMYIHKVIGKLRSNTFVDTPVQSPAKEVIHQEMEDVLRCICTGIDEYVVLKYRTKDVSLDIKTYEDNKI